MSATGLEVFDTTLQKTNAWLNEIMQQLGSDDRHEAYLALRATLHALRDRMNADTAAQLGAQFPMLIRGLYYEGWNPARTPKKARRKLSFLLEIQRQLSVGAEPERMARAVFSVLEMHVSPGEIDDVRHVLNAEIRELWPISSATTSALGEEIGVSDRDAADADVLSADHNERYAG